MIYSYLQQVSQLKNFSTYLHQTSQAYLIIYVKPLVRDQNVVAVSRIIVTEIAVLMRCGSGNKEGDRKKILISTKKKIIVSLFYISTS